MENELVEKNMGLVYYIARSFQKSTTGGIEYDDLVQEGMVGLVKAARTFDESRGFLFSTYAGNCIQKEILAYMKRQRKHKRSISINQDIRGFQGVPVEEILGYSQKEYENVWKRDLLERCIRSLNQSQREIVLLYYGKGLKQKEIAKQLGISQGQVCRIIKRCLEKMRKILGGGGGLSREVTRHCKKGDSQ